MSRLGFTLTELLVVLTILGLVAALGTARIGTGGGARRVETAAHELAAALRRTRGEALRRNLDLALVIDVDARSYRLPGAAPRRLGDGIALELLTAARERDDAATAGIRFFADGSATGGVIAVRGAGAARAVTVDWLSGRVRVVEGGNAP